MTVLIADIFEESGIDLRQHRPGNGEAHPRVRHADRRLEPAVRNGERSDRRRTHPDAARDIAGGGRERIDVISVHPALNADTKGLVNASGIDKLKPGSYFIKTARAEVVDHAALEKAVRERRIRVGFDVFAAEPPGATGVFAVRFV